jgi:predicted transposase/invertase (TIGR01784 family)
MGIEEFILDQAIKEAWEEGFKQGFKEGYEQVKREIALKMKIFGFDLEFISDITDLSVDEVEKIPENNCDGIS